MFPVSTPLSVTSFPSYDCSHTAPKRLANRSEATVGPAAGHGNSISRPLLLRLVTHRPTVASRSRARPLSLSLSLERN
ncbi:hypothetical protein B296_00058119, partial [Ensete ventricosum]